MRKPPGEHSVPQSQMDLPGGRRRRELGALEGQHRGRPSFDRVSALGGDTAFRLPPKKIAGKVEARVTQLKFSEVDWLVSGCMFR